MAIVSQDHPLRCAGRKVNRLGTAPPSNGSVVLADGCPVARHAAATIQHRSFAHRASSERCLPLCCCSASSRCAWCASLPVPHQAKGKQQHARNRRMHGGTGGSSSAQPGIDPRFPILPSFPCMLLSCRCQPPRGIVRVKGRCLPTAGSVEGYWESCTPTERSVGCWSSPKSVDLATGATNPGPSGARRRECLAPNSRYSVKNQK